LKTELNIISGEWLIIVPTVNEAENIGLLIPAILRLYPMFTFWWLTTVRLMARLTLSRLFPSTKNQFSCLQRTHQDGLGRAYIAGF